MGVANIQRIITDTWPQFDPKNRNVSSSQSVELLNAHFYYSTIWGNVFPLITSPTGSAIFDNDIQKLRDALEEQLFLITEDGRLQSGDKNESRKKKDKNILVLNELKYTPRINDDSVPPVVIDNSLRIIFSISHQPELFLTGEASIQMQFETPDRSYLEFEVFETRITAMIVPKRDYDNAVFYEFNPFSVEEINKIVEEFFSAAGSC